MPLVIPAIDIRDGRCVRLHQGSYEDETVYFDDPVKMAKLWRVQNARTLHVVDLDAARGEGENNRTVIGEMCDALDMGVYRVLLGTAAVRNPDFVEEAIDAFSAQRVVVSIDARDGEVRVEGWTEGSGLDAVEFAQEMERRGVRRIVYTDISRDGTMEGPNIPAYRTLGAHLSAAKITASGGVGEYEDLLDIQTLRPYGVDSVIVGTALYENRFPCQQFWTWHDLEGVDLDTFSTAMLRGEMSPSEKE